MKLDAKAPTTKQDSSASSEKQDSAAPSTEKQDGAGPSTEQQDGSASTEKRDGAAPSTDKKDTSPSDPVTADSGTTNPGTDGEKKDGGATTPTGTAPGFPPKGTCFPYTMARGVPPTPTPDLPAAVLDLVPWKITLPIEDDLNCKDLTTSFRTGAKEVKMPLLAQFKDPKYFYVDQADKSVIFMAPAEGATTANSKNIRSELREGVPYDPATGPKEANWSTSSGTHTMIATQAIPSANKAGKVVILQIHDASDDLIMVAYDKGKIIVEHNDGKPFGSGVLDSAYTTGKKITTKIVASGGRVKVYYDDMNTPKIDESKPATGCYFKAGAYRQDSGGGGEGVVKIYDLKVMHAN